VDGFIRIFIGTVFFVLFGSIILYASISPYNSDGVGYGGFLLVVGFLLIGWGVSAWLDAARERHRTQKRLEEERRKELARQAWFPQPPSKFSIPHEIPYNQGRAAQPHAVSQSTPKFCILCGLPNTRESMYCTGCGKPLAPSP